MLVSVSCLICWYVAVGWYGMGPYGMVDIIHTYNNNNSMAWLLPMTLIIFCVLSRSRLSIIRSNTYIHAYEYLLHTTSIISHNK